LRLIVAPLQAGANTNRLQSKRCKLRLATGAVDTMTNTTSVTTNIKRMMQFDQRRFEVKTIVLIKRYQ